MLFLVFKSKYRSHYRCPALLGPRHLCAQPRVEETDYTREHLVAVIPSSFPFFFSLSLLTTSG